MQSFIANATKTVHEFNFCKKACQCVIIILSFGHIQQWTFFVIHLWSKYLFFLHEKKLQSIFCWFVVFQFSIFGHSYIPHPLFWNKKTKNDTNRSANVQKLKYSRVITYFLSFILMLTTHSIHVRIFVFHTVAIVSVQIKGSLWQINWKWTAVFYLCFNWKTLSNNCFTVCVTIYREYSLLIERKATRWKYFLVQTMCFEWSFELR